MDEAKVREVCATYRADLEKKWATWQGIRAALHFESAPFEAKQLSEWQSYETTLSGELSPGDILQHLAFVCEETPRLMAAGRVDKAMRWLGWLQGAVWGLGSESLHAAKRKNMPDVGRSVPAYVAPTTIQPAYTNPEEK